jgi:ArsR family transcriptional regulator, arsenate/arsenite/antimonite-responsive transcriptional repressor
MKGLGVVKWKNPCSPPCQGTATAGGFVLTELATAILRTSKMIQVNLMPTLGPPASLIIAGFHALAVPIRLQVIELLRDRELCVCDLCAALNVAQSKLSFHLKALKDAGLVYTRQEGRWIYYRLNLSQFVLLEQYLSEFRRLSPILPLRQCE